MKKIFYGIFVSLFLALSLVACSNEEKKIEATTEQTKEVDLGIRHISFGKGDKQMIVVPGLSLGFVTDNAEGLENAFATFTEEYTVHVFDVREEVPENYTLEQMGEDLATTMKSLGLEHTYMYGCSMGGMQCIYIAGKYPELVDKVVVASSACKANETSNKVISNWIQLAKDGKGHELTDDFGKLVYSKAAYEAQKEGLAAMADGLTEETLQRFANTANAIIDMDLSEEAASIQCPILVMGGEGDKVLTPAGSHEIAEITGGEIYMYGEDAPHAVYDEAPDFKDRVFSFFEK
ncbi:MAG: alpha/beta hydrolase [Eubacteriales bacterium]|nr:alpha/beta hydrolase [Eubacteriales bacterium]